MLGIEFSRKEFMSHESFNIDKTIEKASKYLCPQGPLREFVAQNPLRGFLGLEFHEALARSAATTGAWSYLELSTYRKAWADGEISEQALKRSLEWNVEDPAACQRARSDLFEYPDEKTYRPLSLVDTGVRSQWEHFTGLNVINKTLPIMFRLLGAYVDQGISVWRMPIDEAGFLETVRKLNTGTLIPYRPFNQPLAKALLNENIDGLIEQSLDRMLGNPEFYERYIFDIIMSHPGWSSTINFLESNSRALALPRKISLKEMIAVELVVDVAFLNLEFGRNFRSMDHYAPDLAPLPMDVKRTATRIDFIKSIWHEAMEWSLYEQSLSVISSLRGGRQQQPKPTVQALFCLDDRECSIRRYIEAADPTIMTFGLPGFFGVDFMYQCADDLFPTRHAPIIINPTHLIKANYDGTEMRNTAKVKRRLLTLDHATHTMLRGWFSTQALGIYSAVRLAAAVFKPSMSQATASSLSKVNEMTTMNFERDPTLGKSADGYFHGFTIDEMAEKIELQLKAIGLHMDFAPIVILFAHGSSSTNNTHFSGYDCGACSGKPGTPNSRVFAKMANNPEVRKALAKRGIAIPADVSFIAALHDTTRDEVKYFDLKELPSHSRKLLRDFSQKMKVALENNAKERCRRFELVNTNIATIQAAEEVKRRSVAIFEPRPELTHTGNAMAIIGGRHLTAGGFFDRRAFLHSYDPNIDGDGQILLRILEAVVPVCGGINLCYYFSKLDGDVYGAGTKLPHNIIGLVGVSNGVEGDLQTGLPSQMVEFHDPVRLQLIIEQDREVVLAVFKKAPPLFIWIENNWIRLVCVDPKSGDFSLWKNGRFVQLDRRQLPPVRSNRNSLDCFKGYHENCRLSVIKSAAGNEVAHGS